jgi:transposase
MREVREVLRLKFIGGLSNHEIARRLGVAPSTVRVTLKRLLAADLSWPLPDDMTDAALEGRLFAAAGTKQGRRRRAEPAWAAIHRELKRKHVTLSILWDEYIARDPDDYRYSRFCELYRSWESKLSVTMRQAHVGGDKTNLDCVETAGTLFRAAVDMMSARCACVNISGMTTRPPPGSRPRAMMAASISASL